MKESQTEGAREGSRRQRLNTVILAVVLAAGLLMLFMIQRRGISGEASDAGEGDGTGPEAVIQMDEEIVHTMPLNENALFRAEDAEGHYNLVEVKDGSVMVREADCKNQVCVRTGRIRNPGEVIACLPHRMIIYIEEGSGTWKTS